MLENDTLDKIAFDIKNCKLCLLWSSRKHTVPGEGGFLKKLMIIGEAPGYSEDQSGRTFIGAAGSIFRKTNLGTPTKNNMLTGKCSKFLHPWYQINYK